MRKWKGSLVAVFAVTACGFSTGCDLAFLEDMLKEGIVTGIRTEVETTAGAVADRVADALGLPDPEK